MKQITTISLFIFWAVVTSVMVAGLVFYQDRQNSTGLNQAVSATGEVLSMKEIAKHSTIDNCWLLISGKVYNITSYFGAHPGGDPAILATCGKDATAAYSTKDPNATSAQGSAHSANALSFLAGYYIGDLDKPAIQKDFSNSTVDSQNIGATTTNVKKPTTPLAQVKLSLQEISKHNKSTDCWLLISGKVYNITSYFGAHPGGDPAILATCGKDATAAYSTKDPNATSAQGSAHSGGAQNLLAGYYIGDLNQTIGQQKIQQTSAVVPPAGGGGDDDDEFDD